MQCDTYRYIHIHVNTCQYIHIHTHTYPRQSVSWRGLGVLLLHHATPMRSATYPDLLGRGSGWDLYATFARGGPMGCTGGLRLPPPDACSAHKCAKMGPGVGPWSRDKVAGLLPMAVRSGARWLPAPPGDVSGLLWAPTHKRVYVGCMWPTYVYMYTHVCQYIHIHAHTYIYMQWLGAGILNEYSIQVQIHTRYIPIHTDTCGYIHIHTHTASNNQCREGFLRRCCARTRPLCWVLPTQISSGRGSGRARRVPIARGGPMGCTGGLPFPLPTRAARTSAPKWVRGWVPDLGIKWQPVVGTNTQRGICGLYVAYICIHVYTCIHMYANTYNTCTYGLISKLANVVTCVHMCAHTCNTCNMDWFMCLTCSTHVAHIHTYTCKYST
jgi:hypothetical protein